MRYGVSGMKVAFACLSLSAMITTAGCKSGWSMPGKDLFSWSKKPSESTLAGSGPSTTYPPSPALNSTPTSIASSGARPGASSGVGSYVTTPPSGSGASAIANGYQTGPYGTASGAAGNSASATPSALTASNTTLGANSGGMTPYGSANVSNSAGVGTNTSAPGYTYAGAPATGHPAMNAYSATNRTPATAASAGSAGMGASPTQGFGGQPYSSMPVTASPYGQQGASLVTSPNAPMSPVGGYPQANPYAAAGSYGVSNPNAATAGTANNPYAAPSQPSNGYTPVGANGASNPYAFGPGASNSMPTQTNVASAANGGYANPFSAMPASTATSYAPGSTQRATTYDFSPNSGAGPSSSGFGTPPSGGVSNPWGAPSSPAATGSAPNYFSAPNGFAPR